MISDCQKKKSTTASNHLYKNSNVAFSSPRPCHGPTVSKASLLVWSSPNSRGNRKTTNCLLYETCGISFKKFHDIDFLGLSLSEWGSDKWTRSESDLVHLSEPSKSQKNCGFRKYFFLIRLAFCSARVKTLKSKVLFSTNTFLERNLTCLPDRTHSYPKNSILYFRTNKFIEKTLINT